MDLLSFDDGEVVDLHTVEGAHNYVSRFLRENGAHSKTFSALGMMFSAKTNQLHEYFGKLEEESFDLRCENVPTGGDDYDIIWIVYSHWNISGLDDPELKIEGQGNTPFEALHAAFSV